MFKYYVCISIVYEDQMIVFDASTLILSAKIELLGLLTDEIDIVITETVEREVTIKQNTFDSKLIRSLIEEGSISVESMEKTSIIEELMRDFNMDEGEASALALYQEKEGELLATDDGQLIKAAKVLGIPFTSSVDFLIRASQKGLLEEDIALEKLKKLQKYGWYKERIIKDAESKIRGE